MCIRDSSPNLKLLIRQDFPRSGDFAFRVEASKGYNSNSIERLVDLRDNKPAKKSNKSIFVVAKDIKTKKDFVLIKNRWLMSKEVPNDVNIKFEYKIPKSGIYHIDLIHPYVNYDASPSFRIGLFDWNDEGIISRHLNLDKNLKEDIKQRIKDTQSFHFDGEAYMEIGDESIICAFTGKNSVIDAWDFFESLSQDNDYQYKSALLASVISGYGYEAGAREASQIYKPSGYPDVTMIDISDELDWDDDWDE